MPDLFDQSGKVSHAVGVLIDAHNASPRPSWAGPELWALLKLVLDDWLERATVLDLVRQVRAVQREYFQTRNPEVLNTAREWERKLDKALKRVTP